MKNKIIFERSLIKSNMICRVTLDYDFANRYYKYCMYHNDNVVSSVREGELGYKKMLSDSIPNYRLFIGGMFYGTQTMAYNKFIIPISNTDLVIAKLGKEPIEKIFNIQCPSNIDHKEFINKTQITLKLMSDKLKEYNKSINSFSIRYLDDYLYSFDSYYNT